MSQSPLPLSGDPASEQQQQPKKKSNETTTTTTVVGDSANNPDGEEDAKWSCRRCTYENFPKSIKCTLCYLSRESGSSNNTCSAALVAADDDKVEMKRIYEAAFNVPRKRQPISPSAVIYSSSEVKKHSLERENVNSSPLIIERNEIILPKVNNQQSTCDARGLSNNKRDVSATTTTTKVSRDVTDDVTSSPACELIGSTSGTSLGVASGCDSLPKATTSNVDGASAAPAPVEGAAATAATEAEEQAKWNCSLCTYLNWPKSLKCVMCGASRDCGDENEAVSIDRIQQQQHHNQQQQQQQLNNRSPILGASANNVIRRQRSPVEEVPPQQNNYISTLRARNALNADRIWLLACIGVVEGDIDPVLRYLNSGGSVARQLTTADVQQLMWQATAVALEPGLTLLYLAIKYQRDDIVALLLSHPGAGGESEDGRSMIEEDLEEQRVLPKRVPSEMCCSVAADIRRHVAASFKQRKGAPDTTFQCFFNTECVTFALPAEVEQLRPSVKKLLFEELLDGDVQKELEEESPIINWNMEITQRLGSRLYALWNRSAGDCLLDSVLQATWGVFDRDNTLRKVLSASLCDAANVLYPRWKEAETLLANMMQYSLAETQWQEDWANLVSLATQPGTALEQLHIFTLAHILRRPIIVYGVKYVKSFRGEALGFARFEGVYLPLLWESPTFCWKSPIALGYTRGHFSALVPMTPHDSAPTPTVASRHNNVDLLLVPRVTESGATNNRSCSAAASGGERFAYLPLTNFDGQLLPLHFLTQNEIGREEELIRAWLDCCLTESGQLVARQRLPSRSPTLVQHMLDEWIQFYKNIETSSPPSGEELVIPYSSDNESD